MRRVILALTCVFTAVAPRLTAAQVVRGVVRSWSSSLPIEQAQVTVRDSVGNVLAVATTDAKGAWALRLRRGGPFELRVRRLGFEMGSARVTAPAGQDTLEYEFFLHEIAANAAPVTVTGIASLNERRLSEAYRRGWKVYEPELVAEHRDRTPDFVQLLRTLGTPSLILPRTPADCVRNTRTNQCLAYVVDGQIMGFQALILPSDVYFFAILSPSESRVQYGERAPNGAIAIFTRSNTDRVQPGRRRP